MPRSAAAPILCLAFFWAGCFDGSSSVATAPARTLLTVDPASFLGPVQCSPSELRRYVVTLKSVAPPAIPATRASPPVDCTNRVSFSSPPLQRDVDYTARIDGYDREDIVPETETELGDPVMKDPVTGALVLPRWTTTCGEGEDAGAPGTNPLLAPTRLFGASEVFLQGCLPLHPVGAPPAMVPEAGTPDSEAGAPDGQADTSDEGSAGGETTDGGAPDSDDGSTGGGG